MNLAVKLVARSLWIYSFITLALVLGVAAWPGVLLAHWAWTTKALGGWVMPEPVWLLWGTVFSFAGYFVMGIALMLLLPVLRVVMGLSTGEGTVPIRSFKVWSWYNYNGLILAFQTLFGKFWRSSSLYVLFLRAMGAKIGKNVIVNSNTVYDHDMLEIGDNAVIGGDAAIIGHIGEKGHLVRKKVRIGKGCTIGQYTTVFPGATIGDNCHVGAMSLVPKDAKLDANAVYGGVPARKIKDLKPGDRSSVAQQADPEALAIELEKQGQTT
ncbi:MAG: acyltransferase [Thermoplasmatota archaeon]